MDLAGHDGGHEERQGGHREEEVDLAALDAERGGDRAHDDEEPEQVARLLPGYQGDHDAEQGAPASTSTAVRVDILPSQRISPPAAGRRGRRRPAAWPAAVRRGPSPHDRGRPAKSSGSGPRRSQPSDSGERAPGRRAAPAGRRAVSRGARSGRRGAWPGRQARRVPPATRAGVPAASGGGAAARPLPPGIGVVCRPAARPAWRTPSGIAARGTGPGLPPRWCAHCWRG